jgi:hypothetical protein
MAPTIGDVMKRLNRLGAALLATAFSVGAPPCFAQQSTSQTKPNILVIMADDIGYWNISAYNRGIIGYRTPNSIASLTKARSSPITTASNPAPRGARRSSPAKAQCALGC